MGLDPLFPLMEDRVDGEVGFEIFEGFFDGDELDAVLPKDGGVAFDKTWCAADSGLRGGGSCAACLG